MKTSVFYLFAGVIILTSIATGCKEDGPVTVPFEADFYTDLVSLAPDAGCSAPKSFLNIQSGAGTASELGGFTTTITFCVDPNTFEYDNGEGSFVGENGDAIFFIGSGQVLPSDEPGYDLEFFDDFTITGGSGRFEGATGEMTSESYVNMTTNRTDHVWTGTITLNQ